MRILLVIVLLTFGLDAQAVSLAGRATDSSVCDLSPLTSYRLTQRTFVPARTKQVSEIYARLALQFITTECKNGQQLILHTEFGSYDDDSAFRQVSHELCNISDVQREPTPTSDYPHSFQIKCRIQKMQDAKDQLAAAEAKQSVDEMIRTRSPWIESDRQSDSGLQQDGKNECPKKLTVGQVLFGMGGNCGRD